MDIEYDGLRIKSWIERADSIKHSLLVGCEISNEDSIWIITEANNEYLEVIKEDEIKVDKVNLGFLHAKAVFIPSEKLDLLKDIDANKSPAEALEDQAELILKRHSISPNLLNGGLTVLKFAKILDEWDKTQIVPSEEDRIYLYEASKQTMEVSRAMVPLVRKWCEKIESYLDYYDAPSRLCLAVLLRVSGSFDESLKVSDVIDLPQAKLKCSSHMRAMLCCDRAAVFLDKFERNHNREYLDKAEKYLKRAFANEQSEAVSLCYQRLRSYKTSEGT
jgi:hypothetical protein